MPEGPRELRLVVTAPDYDAALRFYRDVLGLREEASFVDDNGGRATLMHAGRATLELADDLHAEAIDALEVERRTAGPVRLAFEVEDAARTTERLLAAGATQVAPPTRTPWGSLNARLDGPDGQQLTVYSSDRYVTERPRLDGQVVLAEADPAWSGTAARLTRDIRRVLARTAMVLEHVGSTSVPGLPAKPVIDLVLGVPDPVDEAAYVPALESLGYQLHIREPEWHEHRLLKHTEPAVNLHVFAAGAEEIDRMLAFRDHLRRDPGDRDLYLRTKRELAARTWAHVQDYADAKSEVVAEIMHRALAQGPGPLRGCVVLVAVPDDGGVPTLARELADRLGLPLLSAGTVRMFVPDPGAVDDLLLALAADSGGAVLASATVAERDVTALPLPVVEVATDPAGTDLGALTALTRRIRQMVGSAAAGR